MNDRDDAATEDGKREAGPSEDGAAAKGRRRALPPNEMGGRDGPDPTRYGDWEKKGICVDF